MKINMTMKVKRRKKMMKVELKWVVVKLSIKIDSL